MQTGENEQALRKIIDFTRLISITILIIHFYLCCYSTFQQWQLTHKIVDHILLPFARMGIFKTITAAKLSALGLLIISLIGSKGKKDEKIRPGTIITYVVTGLTLYFVSNLFCAVGNSLYAGYLSWVFTFFDGRGTAVPHAETSIGRGYF